MDRSKGSPPPCVHRLSEKERKRILLTCNEPESGAMRPCPDRSCRSWRSGACSSAQSTASTEAGAVPEQGCIGGCVFDRLVMGDQVEHAHDGAPRPLNG
jgi:hypothetical protein